MSDTAPSRPQPKPRPRPRPVNAQPPPHGNASSSSTNAAGSLPLGEIVINDSDDLFVINRGRTKETWKKLDEINQVAARVTSDSESDAEPSTPLRKRVKRQDTPKWQNNENAIRLLSIEVSDDSDSDIEIQPTTPGKGKKVPSSPNKRKRQKDRSRSRSITPPPEVPAAILANARNVIRQALEIPRAPSPTAIDDFEDSTDTIILDPELERIAKAVITQSSSNQSAPGTGERLTIRVKWQKHPLNPGEPEPTWSYAMPRDESFTELFDAVADDAQILVNALILSYKNKRIYSSTRPDALGLWGEVELVGCHERTYNHLLQQAREVHQTQSPVKAKSIYDTGVDKGGVINIASDHSDDEGDEEESDSTNSDHGVRRSPSINASPPNPKTSQESDAESESGPEKFKLVLRSNKVPKDITLIVRPKTTCGAIVRAYIKKAGLTNEYPHLFNEGTVDKVTPPQVTRGRGRGRGRGGRGRGKAQAPAQALPDPRISVDGDRMDNNAEIGTADLEDGDMVEVIGL